MYLKSSFFFLSFFFVFFFGLFFYFGDNDDGVEQVLKNAEPCWIHSTAQMEGAQFNFQ